MKFFRRKKNAAVLLICAFIGIFTLTSCQSANEPELTVQAKNSFEKTLTVATDDDYWPYVYHDENGQLTGHDIELITLVANKLNMNLEIYPMTWEESLLAVRNHEADAVLTCEYTGKEVVDGIITTSPVKSDDFVVFSKNDISSADTLFEKRIGVMKNGNVVKSITEHGLEDACIYYDSNRKAFDALAKDECDCVIVRYIIGLGIIDEMGAIGSGIDGYISLSDSRACIGVAQENEELADEISRVINDLRADGTLEKLNEKWIQAHYPERNFRGFLKKNKTTIALSAALLLAIIAVFFIFQRRSYNQIIRFEREHSSELEKAKTAAEAANAAKSTFLFNMSHDIRTPLNAIKGFNEMALKNYDDKSKAMESLIKVRESCDLLITIANNILDMSHIENGETAVYETEVNIKDIFKNIRPVLEEQAKGKNITLDFEIGSIKNEHVLCDAVHIHQILVNLISNAVKYNNEGGNVWVSLTQFDIGTEETGSYRFTVKDNGYGMSADYRKVAFDMFSREENSTKSGIQGVGLGLPLCKKLTEMMGGSIAMESELGVGSTFTVILPLKISKAEHQATGKQADDNENTLKGKKILLVEDNELNREIAADILEEWEITVESAEDGKVAVEMAEQKGADYYDCILMDIQMPNMNGYEATETIRAMYPDADLPIIALSANAFEEDKKKSFESGMNAHIAKPIDIKELNNVLTNFICK